MLSSLLGYLTLFIALLLSWNAFFLFRRRDDHAWFLKGVAVGVILYTLGELLFLLSREAYPGPADLLFVPGILAFLAAFVILLPSVQRERLSLKEIFLFATLLLIMSALLWYLFTSVIDQGATPWQTFLNFFYPVTSTIIFLFAYYYQAHTRVKSGWLFYIVAGFLFSAIADLLFSYASWKGIYGLIGVAYDLLYAASYLLWLLAFRLLRRE